MAQIGQLPGGGRAFGDIYVANTPALDRFGAQLYQEQRQREALRAKQQQMLDEEFAKNMSNMRDIDIPELTKKYGEFKLANQMLMRKKGGITSEDQLDLLRKKASFYDTVNKSKALREEDHDWKKGMQSHPERYDDNAYDYLMERMQTPLSQLGVSKKFKDEKGVPIDLLSGKSYLYKGTDYDMGKALKMAAGTPKNTPFQLKEQMKGGLGENITNYQFGNDPVTFKEQLQGQFATNKGGRAAAAIWESIPDDQKQLVDQMYNDIPLDKWEKIRGKKERPTLIVFNPESKAEQLATYYAKLHAVNNEPIPLKTQQLYDKDAIMNRQLKERQAAADLRFGRSKELIALNKGAGNFDFDVIGKYLPNVIDIPEQNNSFGLPTRPKMTVIDATQIDPHDLKTITANKVYPKTINGKEVFEVDQNGNLIGDGNQKIDRYQVAVQRSKEIPNTVIKRGAPVLKEINKKLTSTSKNKWDQYKRN